MGSNKLAFAALGVACIAAAGGGAYFALRQNAVQEPAAVTATAPTPSTGPASEPAILPEKPVQETEAVVAPREKAVAKTTKKADSKPEKAPPQTAAAAPKPVTQAAPAPQIVIAPEPTAPPRADAIERAAQDTPPPAAAAPQHSLEELVVSTDSVIGLQSDTTVTSERARVEDRVEARVTRDVKVGDRVAIPAGSRAIGYVTQVERGGKFKEQAKLAIRFQTIVLADGTQVGSLEPDSTSAAPAAQTAPKLDLATLTAQDGSTTLHATPIDAETGSGF